MKDEMLLLEHKPVAVVVPRQTLTQYMEQKKNRKIKRVARGGILQRIKELRYEMKRAGIDFKWLSLRSVRQKGWSGYYGYLISTVRSAGL